MRFTDERGTDIVVNFTEEMRAIMKKDNRWRGHNVADEDGCYVHYLPTHGPNLYELKMVGGDHAAHMPVNGIRLSAMGGRLRQAVRGKDRGRVRERPRARGSWPSRKPRSLRFIVGGRRCDELGCGLNPKAPRFDIYPAGPNSPGALHFGTNGLKASEYLRRVRCRTGKSRTSTGHGRLRHDGQGRQPHLIDKGFLMALRDPQVVAAAERYGDPVDLLENFPV